ncbi:MAG: RNA polymerase sigma factor, partial [Verrucomicrobiae bacterium]|nr:RNA polymerase sigma factor [Verrucomicrobiae bacterium]
MNMRSDNVLPETPVSAATDAEVIVAIRDGDAERYRELVERHQRRVFAVAWSRLGDPALAEDATQETFIRAYHRLWMLGDGNRFGSWITSIARHVAINLGLSHRREQDKRARWALEQPTGDTHAPGDGEWLEAQGGETLRQSLEDLTPTHRECLVLYYLEGKSGPDAAVALGISETAFRVRLHRARSALRDQLESRLEDSLGRLRPGSHVAGVILSAIPISSTAKSAASGILGAGLGQKGLASLLPSGLFAWMVPLLPWLASFPSILFMGWVHRMERQNLRDPDGFRAQASRTAYRHFAWIYPLVLLPALIGGYAAMEVFGFSGYNALATVFLLFLVFQCVRALAILRNRYQVGQFVAFLLLFAGFPARAMDLLPASLAMLPTLLAMTVQIWIIRDRPSRMDYSLFLRAAHGSLDGMPPGEGVAPRFRAGLREWFDFARFLGDQCLVVNFRCERDGLRLRLAPA